MKPPSTLVIQERRVHEALDKPWIEAPQSQSLVQQMALASVRSQSLDLHTVMPPAIVQQHQQKMSIAQYHHLDMPFLGCSLTFNEPRIYRGDNSDWAIMPLEQDSFYIHNGGHFVVPKSTYQMLKKMNRVGIDFHQLIVGHEMPKGIVQEGQPIHWSYLAPPAPPNKVARLRILDTATNLYAKAVGGIVLTAGVATALAATVAIGVPVLVAGAALALPATVSGLDPILFGVTVDYSRTINGQHPSLVYVLAQWAWPKSK